MNHKVRPYFLVLGYGILWHPGHGRYLDRVAGLARDVDPAWILLCGGVNGDDPDQPSEAAWMAYQLEQRGMPSHLLRLEERSRTTFENFIEADKCGWLVRDRPIVVFCDRWRLAKIRAIVRHLRLADPRFEALPMEYPWRSVAVRLKSTFDALRVCLWGLPKG